MFTVSPEQSDLYASQRQLYLSSLGKNPVNAQTNPGPFGATSRLYDLFGIDPATFAGITTASQLSNYWNTVISSDPTSQQIYARWLDLVMNTFEVQTCLAQGWKVDSQASLALGYGRAFTDSAQKSMYNLDPSTMTLFDGFRLVNDWFTWGAAWITNALSPYLSPSAGFEQMGVDYAAGRLKFKFVMSGWGTAGGIGTAALRANPDSTSYVEDKAAQGFFNTPIVVTDASLQMLLGLAPGPDGKRVFSPLTVANLVCSNQLSFVMEPGSGLFSPDGTQLGYLYATNLFQKPAVDKWVRVGSQMAAIFGKHYGLFAQLQQDFDQMRAIFNAWLLPIISIETMVALATKEAITFSVLAGVLGISILTAQGEIALPDAAALTLGIKIAAAAFTDQTINWETVVAVGFAAVSEVVDVTDVTDAIGVSQDTVDAVTSTADTVTTVTDNVPTSTDDLKDLAGGQVQDALGSDFQFDQGEDLVDILGINIDTSSGGLSDIASSIGDATGASDTLQGILDSIPTGVSDVATTVAGSVSVSTVPAAPAPAPSAAKPVAVTAPAATAAKSLLPVAAIAGYFLLKR